MPIFPKGAVSIIVISRVTGLNVTKFVHDIQTSLPFKNFTSGLRSLNPFRNASATNEGGVGNFTPKLVRFRPVTPEFKRGKCIHLLVDQQFSYVRLAALLLDTAVISTEFCGAISTHFVSPVR